MFDNATGIPVSKLANKSSAGCGRGTELKRSGKRKNDMQTCWKRKGLGKRRNDMQTDTNFRQIPRPGSGSGVRGLEFGVWGLGFGVWGLGFRVEGRELRGEG